MTRLFTLCIVLSAMACVAKKERSGLSSGVQSAFKADSVRVFALTDFHGHLEPKEFTITRGGQEHTFKYGGAGYIASYLNFLRSKPMLPHVVLDAGDLFQGTYVSNSNEGVPVIDYYNLLKIDAAALGNHEFDFGPQGVLSIPKSSRDNPTGNLERLIKRAKFPILAANVFEARSKKKPSWLKSSVIVKKPGVTIGIIGASTPMTPKQTNVENVRHLRFSENLAYYIQKEAAQLRRSGATLVFLTIHEGGSCLVNLSEFGEQIENNCEGDIFPLAEKLLGYVNGIVAGHTHQSVNKVIRKGGKEIFILQPKPKGQEVLFADVHKSGKIALYDGVPICPGKIMDKSISFDGKQRTVRGCDKYFVDIDRRSSDRVLSIKDNLLNGKPIRPDPQVVALLQPYIDRAEKNLKRPANATPTNSFTRNFKYENALGNFMTSLVQKATGAEVVLLNNGGLRSELPAKALTYNEIYEILPFDDDIVTGTISGANLKRVLAEDAQSRMDEGYSWAGLRATITDCKIKRMHLKGRDMRVVPIFDNREIRFATSRYLFGQLQAKLQLTAQKDIPGTFRDMVFREVSKMDLAPATYFDARATRISYSDSCGLDPKLVNPQENQDGKRDANAG